MVIDPVEKRRHVLITGFPGVGKTTLVCALTERLAGTVAGFITREVREGGVRVGFEIETLGGITAPLADTSPTGFPRVGKYRVLLRYIDEVAVPAILEKADFIVIDEIGKMESLSSDFVRAVQQAFSGRAVVIATIAMRGNTFIEGIKKRPDVTIYEVTRENRETLADVILGSILGGVPG